MWVKKLKSSLIFTSLVDPDPKDPHQFAGSGTKILSTDPDSDLKLQLLSLKTIKQKIILLN